MLRTILASLHLIALGIGLGAVLTRGSLLRGRLDVATLRLALRYDTMWGIAALLWIITGAWRYMGSLEKDFSYYNSNHLFLTKMVLLLVVLVLEVKPMFTLLRWRRELAAGREVESFVTSADSARIARVSHIEAIVIVLMVVLASGMARGIGG